MILSINAISCVTEPILFADVLIKTTDKEFIHSGLQERAAAALRKRLTDLAHLTASIESGDASSNLLLNLITIG
jgi:hypothetical protein